MAQQYDAGLLPRTYFRAPRVPFDFRALALGILGYLIYWGGGLLLSEIFGKNDVPGAFLAWWSEFFQGIPYVGGQVQNFLANVFGVDYADYSRGDYGFWHILVGGVWFFGVWSFFALGIHRITSLRIARDEGLGLFQALGFSFKHWRSLLLVPVIVAAAMGFFFLCNGLAGLTMSIPFVGGLLGVILVPLAAVSTLIMLLIGLGGVFGLPLIGASASWECNGALDAISRAFSYVFARPLQYFWNLFLVFLFTGIILLVGAWFTFAFTKSVDWLTVSDTQTVLIDSPQRSLDQDSDYEKLSTDAKNLNATLEANTGYKPGQHSPGTRGGVRANQHQPYARDIQSVWYAPWTYKINALLFWLLINAAWVTIFGYAIFWFTGAMTSIYADLRADVDGTPEDDIYSEEDEEDFEKLVQDGPTTESAVAAADEASAQATSGDAATAVDTPPATADSDTGTSSDSGASGDSGGSPDTGSDASASGSESAAGDAKPEGDAASGSDGAADAEGDKKD